MVSILRKTHGNSNKNSTCNNRRIRNNNNRHFITISRKYCFVISLGCLLVLLVYRTNITYNVVVESDADILEFSGTTSTSTIATTYPHDNNGRSIIESSSTEIVNKNPIENEEKNKVLLPLQDNDNNNGQQVVVMDDSRYRKPNTVIDDSINIPKRKPTHTACDKYDGIYHIAMGDIGGAAGTIFFQFVIAQIMYAERNNLLPWVYLSNVSNVIYDNVIHGSTDGVTITALTGRNATYYHRPRGHKRDYTPGPINMSIPVKKETLHFVGTGVWEHYFEPISNYIPGDVSCENKLYVTMDLYLITPGLHGYATYAPRCWRYKYIPDYITKPHLSISEWLHPQRMRANKIITKYIHPKQYLQTAAYKVNPDCSIVSPCLGLHIRHSDKASGRRIVETKEFLPFVETFVNVMSTLKKINNNFHIYLATDSTLVLNEIQQSWSKHIQDRIRTADVLRSSTEQAVFDLDGASQHHRANQEILIEMIALSQCQFIIHGFSAVSESAIWMNNNNLLHTSVNLEDIDHINTTQFQTLIEMVTDKTVPKEKWPKPILSIDVWPELYDKQQLLSGDDSAIVPSNTACEGFDGILHISAIGRTSSAGGAFFTSILNQLLFAEQHNLKPWIHLKSNNPSTVLIYDQNFHGNASTSLIEFEMLQGMVLKVELADKTNKASQYPGEPVQQQKELTSNIYSVAGNGIWTNYFEPVSDFVPGDESCRNKPLIEMEEILVSPGLEIYAPWSIRAWQYDNLPASLWWDRSGNISLKDWLLPIRNKASQIIQKYYHFRPFIQKRADEVNPVKPGQPCLGIHLRNSDKIGEHRSKIRPKEFEVYLDAFVKAGGRAAYVATDSHKALQFIQKNYPEHLTRIIRSQGPYVVRSTKLDWPAHYIDDHHRVNSEVLVDILALSKCQLLLHGFSTVSEAAIYLNQNLVENSVNLEDPGRITPESFAELTRQVIGNS